MRAAGSHHSDEFWNSMRNHQLEPMVDAALEALGPEFHVLRIGNGGAPILARGRFLDTIPLGLDFRQQLALLSECRFFMGGVSGPITFAWILGKPLLIVNNPLIGNFLTRAGVPMVGLEKHVKVAGVTVSPAEVPLLEGGGAPGRLNDQLGYRLEDNTSLEIRTAIEDLKDLMNRNEGSHWVYSRGRKRLLQDLVQEYTGCAFPGRTTGYPQVFMAFERAIHALMNPGIERLFEHFPPTRRYQAGFYGAGALGSQAVGYFRNIVNWDLRFFDGSVAKQGQPHEGIFVEPPGNLVFRPPDFLVLTTSRDEEPLLEKLQSEGWSWGENLFLWSKLFNTTYRTFHLNPERCAEVRDAALAYLGEAPS